MVEFTPEILAQAKAMGYTEEEAREKWSEINEEYNQGGPAVVIADMTGQMGEFEGELSVLAESARVYFPGSRHLTKEAQNWVTNASKEDARVLGWAQYAADVRNQLDEALVEENVDVETLLLWLITGTWMIAELQDQVATLKDGNRRRGEAG